MTHKLMMKDAMVVNGVSLGGNYGHLSVALMTMCVPYRYFLVIQPFKNRTKTLVLAM